MWLQAASSLKLNSNHGGFPFNFLNIFTTASLLTISGSLGLNFLTLEYTWTHFHNTLCSRVGMCVYTKDWFGNWWWTCYIWALEDKMWEWVIVQSTEDERSCKKQKKTDWPDDQSLRVILPKEMLLLVYISSCLCYSFYPREWFQNHLPFIAKISYHYRHLYFAETMR